MAAIRLDVNHRYKMLAPGKNVDSGIVDLWPFVLLEESEPNSPFIVLTPLTISKFQDYLITINFHELNLKSAKTSTFVSDSFIW